MRKTLIGSLFVGVLAACGGQQQSGPTPPPLAPTASTPVATATTTAPPAPTETTPQLTPAQKMAATGKALVDAYNAHDPDKIAAAFATDGVLRAYGSPDAVGRDAIKKSMADAFTAFPDFKIAGTRMWTKGNTSAVEYAFTGTNTGSLHGHPATGRPVGAMGLSVVTFNDDGTIKEEHQYIDGGTIAQQLDAKAKAGSFRAIPPLPTGPVENHVSQGTPAEQKDVDAANALYQAINDHKLDAFLALIPDDAQFDDMATPSTMTGKADAKKFFAAMLSAFPDLKQSNGTQIAADDFVVTEGTLQGTQRGPLMGMKATNKPVTLHYADVFQFKDGKFVRGWTYDNGLEMMQASGQTPAAAH